MTLNAIYNDAITTATGNAVQQFAAIIKRKLCKKVCSQQSLQPTFNVTYALTDVSTQGTTTFATITATGSITYVPKGACGCNTITQAFFEQTQVIFTNASATSAPTLSIVQGLSDGQLADFSCLTASAYQIATSVTVTATYA